MRILLVDDHRDVRELVGRALESEGHVVTTCSTLAAARSTLRQNSVDLLVLDLGLPDGDGLDFCRELRASRAEVPILLLTARSEISERVAGLGAGADDYLPKPFAVAELRARVRAIARRPGSVTTLVVARGDSSVDFGRREARRAGRAIALTAREWAILDLLVARRGRVVPKTEILDSVWGEITENGEASLEVLVGRIRRKLGEDLVRTVRGEGYALADV